VKAVFVVLAVAFLAGGCSDDKPAPQGQVISQQTLKQDCSNPKWREENLGLWYSVCRRPMQW
jgi:hypothetical protein